ncbi:MAG: DUF503 domain-containing protein [Pseudomonadaceae bacterium]|nr:DUF503 domain-containing protein [Pseudomonadaceae bacterium]
MNIACLTIVFHLHGCSSLKDKRQRLAGLRDRFGKQTQVAVCESADADSLSRAQWSFVATAGTKTVIQKIFSDIETFVTTNVDAEVVDIRRQWLN